MKVYRILILTLFAYALISCGGAEERKEVYLEKARVSFEAGDLDKARIELKNVLQIDPKDGDAYYQLGKVYEQQKEYRKAYGNYLKAEELKPELLENHARLGRFYLLLMNDTEKAQEKIDVILTKEPNNSDGLLLKAALMLRSNNAVEAMKIAQVIIAQDPGHTESISFLTALYMKEKDYKEAINLLDVGLKNNQNNEKLNRLLAQVLVLDKDYERAEVIYKDFLERNPNSISSYINLAVFYSQKGDKIKAEEVFRASVDNSPSNDDRILILIKYIRDIKGTDEAIKELKTFITENNRIGKLRTALAELHILNSDMTAAVKVYKQTINDFPEEITGIVARTSLASIYVSDKKYDKAGEVIEDAYLISPNNPQVNFLRAKLSVRDKDMEKAIISLRIVTKEMPENIEAYILLANIYQQEGNKEQVNSTLNNAYDNNKTNVKALLKLAQYHMKSDIKKSEKIIDHYNAIKDPDYDGLSIKATILNKNKQYSQAVELARKLMDLYPAKPNGYLQAIPYYALQEDKIGAMALLEKGYLNVKNNRRLLILLTTLQMEDKKFDIVEKRIKAELTSVPDDTSLKILLAKVYIFNKDIDVAKSLFKDIIESNPSTEEPYLLLSQIYQNEKDQDAVKGILIKGKDNVKTSLKIPLKLAMIYEVEKSYGKAINIYRDIYDIYPGNLLVINNLASMLSDYGDAEEDLTYAKTLAEKLKESGQPVFLDTIGWIEYKLGNYQDAIRYLSQVIEKSAEINVFNYHLGMAYKMAGDKKQAKIYLEKSLVTDSKKFKEKSLAEAALKDI